MNEPNQSTDPAKELRVEINQLRAEMNAQFAALEKKIVDGHAAILAALKQHAPR